MFIIEIDPVTTSVKEGTEPREISVWGLLTTGEFFVDNGVKFAVVLGSPYRTGGYDSPIVVRNVSAEDEKPIKPRNTLLQNEEEYKQFYRRVQRLTDGPRENLTEDELKELQFATELIWLYDQRRENA